MTARKRLTRGGTIAALALGVGLTAQEPQQPPPAAPQPGGPGQAVTELPPLEYEREVFTYPTFERRDPFRSLVGDIEVGPRWESMALIGTVVVDADPSRSIAIIRSGTQEGQAAPTRRLRTGQSWGNVRILEIRRNEVLVEVEEFGMMEQRIMRLPTRGQGGS